MLLHLAMMLSKVSGWGLTSDDKAYDSSHESAISGEVDGGARAIGGSCGLTVSPWLRVATAGLSPPVFSLA